MIVKPDFSGVTRRFIDPIDGWYHVKIVECQESKIRNSEGFVQLRWKLQIVESKPEYNGYNLFYNTPIGGKFAFMLSRLTDLFGIDVKEGFDTNAMLGNKMTVQLVSRTYQDKTGSPRLTYDIKKVTQYIDEMLNPTGESLTANMGDWNFSGQVDTKEGNVQ